MQLSKEVPVPRLITCPETGHLEEIDFDVDPVDGHILGVRGCSRHARDGDVPCEQTCVARLNARLPNLIAAERRARVAAGRPARHHLLPLAEEEHAADEGDPAAASPARPAR